MIDEDLERAAASTKEEPWLFFRVGLDWRWRSRQDVARRVLSVRNCLEGRLEILVGEGARVSYRPGLELAGVHLSLAVAAVRDTQDLRGAAFANGSEVSVIDLDERFDLVAGEGEEDGINRSTIEPISVIGSRNEIRQSIDDLKRVIGTVGKAGRPHVCLSPRLSSARRQAAVVWAFAGAKALIVEPDAELFAPTLVWARPNVVICNSSELPELAESLSDWASGRLRRFLRLRRIVTADHGRDPDLGDRMNSPHTDERPETTESSSRLSTWPEEIEICRWER